MNNGRMTFRFDGNQGRQRTETAERREVNETGVVLENKDTDKVQRGEIKTSSYSKADEYIVDLEKVELPRPVEAAYLKPPGSGRRKLKAPEDNYDLGLYSVVRPASARHLWEESEDSEDHSFYGGADEEGLHSADEYYPCMKITVNPLQTVMINPELKGIATAALIIPAVPRIGGSSHCPSLERWEREFCSDTQPCRSSQEGRGDC